MRHYRQLLESLAESMSPKCAYLYTYMYMYTHIMYTNRMYPVGVV